MQAKNNAHFSDNYKWVSTLSVGEIYALFIPLIFSHLTLTHKSNLPALALISALQLIVKALSDCVAETGDDHVFD